MSLIAKDLPALIFLLMPGFMAAGIFYTLTAHPKTSEFERLVQSLIFSTLVRVCLAGVKPWLFSMGRRGHDWGKWSDDVELVWSVVIALFLGLVFALLANSDAFHKLMRILKLSNRTFHPSEWYGVFKRQRRNVLLHLKGGRRLRGWPADWPDQPDKGHLVIRWPAWILDDESVSRIDETYCMMIPASEVEMVEFLKDQGEIDEHPHETTSSERSTADARNLERSENDGIESAAGSA